MEAISIGGLQKESLIDWDGKLTAVVFTQGCNFRCGYCHNPSLVIPKLIRQAQRIAYTEVMSYLASRKSWLDGVVVTGGEPTMHAGLRQFIVEIKQLGFPVKLDTNGTNPALLESLINDGLVDYVAMDVKSVPQHNRYQQITPINEDVFRDVLRSITVLKQNRVPYEFRTTQIPKLHSEEDMAEIKAFLEGKAPYKIQHFREADVVANYAAS